MRKWLNKIKDKIKKAYSKFFKKTTIPVKKNVSKRKSKKS